MIAARSSDGRYILVVFEVGEAIAYRDAIEEVKPAGKLADLGNALTTLLPTRLEVVRGKKTRKGKK